MPQPGFVLEFLVLKSRFIRFFKKILYPERAFNWRSSASSEDVCFFSLNEESAGKAVTRRGVLKAEDFSLRILEKPDLGNLKKRKEK